MSLPPSLPPPPPLSTVEQPMLYQSGFVGAELTIVIFCLLALLISFKWSITASKLMLTLATLMHLCEKILFLSSPFTSAYQCSVVAEALQGLVGTPSLLVRYIDP